MSLCELQRFEEASHALETATFHLPENGEAWGRLGQAYGNLGRHADAVRAFEKAVELGFGPSGLWLNLGQSAAELGDLRRVSRAYRHLRDEYPDEAGILEERMKKLHEARRARRQRRGRGHSRAAAGSSGRSQRRGTPATPPRPPQGEATVGQESRT